MSFVNNHKQLFTIGSILTIAMVIVYNAYVFINAFTVPPVPTDSNPNPSSSFSLVTTLITVAIAIVFISSLVIVANLLEKQKTHRDHKRVKDLKVLLDAFEAYYADHGQYPISATYLPDYYSGINLSNDWHYYGLPNDDQMRQYAPEWPISDPSISYHGKQQQNQYLYYPKDNGARFDLYAHLEHPVEPKDYNKADDLPHAWGEYNYKISSLPKDPKPTSPPIDKPIILDQQPQ